VLSKDYVILWHSQIPLKIQIFLWLVRKNKILTKKKLLKGGWQGSSQCVFCSDTKNINHLFIMYPFVQCIWKWIGNQNYFQFESTSLEDIWVLDGLIPYKNIKLVEMIRGAVLWTI
jgi:zinc-binding in reverse transcriptase